MISKEYIRSVLDTYEGGEDFFVVDVVVTKGNVIRVFVDRTEGITISECSTISRFLHEKLDRDKEDFELMVSSPGLDRPLQVWEQYHKNIGRELKIKLKDGSEVRGMLTSVDKKQIMIEPKVKKNKKKNPGLKPEPTKTELQFDQIDTANVVLTI